MLPGTMRIVSQRLGGVLATLACLLCLAPASLALAGAHAAPESAKPPLAPPVPGVARPDHADAAALLDELAVRFPKTLSWFGQVADMGLLEGEDGLVRPDFTTAANGRIIRWDGAGQMLSPAIAPRADGAFRVALTGRDGFWVTTRSLDARPAEMKVARGVAVYPDGMPEGDLLVKFTPTHVDEYVYIREARDGVVWRYALELGPEVSGLLETPRGVVVLDLDGTPRLRINRPFAHEASGAKRFGTATLEEGVLVLRLDLTGLEFPVLVDPDWVTTGLMTAERLLYHLLPLPDGSALAPGGCRYTGCPNGMAHPFCSLTISEVDRFDPITRTWTAAPALTDARYAYAAAVLPDDRIVVAGGCQNQACADQIASVEVFDPVAFSWSMAGALTGNRAYGTAVTLPSGEVLFIGGCNDSACANVTDVWDPVTGVWSTRAGLLVPRAMHTSTLLPDGRVLVIGGCSSLACDGVLATSEIYDPGSDSWTFTTPMDSARYGHAVNLLCDGSVLISGGCPDVGCTSASNSVLRWVYGEMEVLPAMKIARHHHTTTLLPDGRLLVTGGCLASPSSVICSEAAEIFDPTSCSWSGLDPLPVYLGSGRGYHVSLRLPSGDVVVAGGCNQSTCLADVDLYEGEPGDLCVGVGPMECGDLPPPPRTDAGPPPGTDAAPPDGVDAGPVILPAPLCSCRVGVKGRPGTVPAVATLWLLLGLAVLRRRLRR